jgi:voltage-gated potassium channel
MTGHDGRREHETRDTPGDLGDERAQLARRLEQWLETPMLALAFAWLALLVIELVRGTSALFETIGLAIWGIFIIDFLLEFTLAPRKLVYLKSNWLTALSLLVPALRIFRMVRLFRAFRMARAARGLRLLRVVSSVNRSMGALGASLNRRGFAYVAGLTLLVTLAGAAGMYAFENDVPNGMPTYGEALWWTAMIMTTMGSDYWPRTGEGRALCVLLSLYAFAVFGYVTAALASFFIGRDAARDDTEIAGRTALDALRSEITLLRTEVSSLRSDA